jgi:hypothetical protein
MRGSIHINSADSSRVDSIFVLRKPPVEVVGDRATAVNERLIGHVQNLVDAGLTVTNGDRRCIRHGLLAEDAMRALAPTWDLSAPITERMAVARERLVALSENADVDAPLVVPAILAGRAAS